MGASTPMMRVDSVEQEPFEALMTLAGSASELASLAENAEALGALAENAEALLALLGPETDQQEG